MLTMTSDAPLNGLKSTASTPQRRTYTPTILVVDDDDNMRLLLRCILEKGGYQVVAVHKMRYNVNRVEKG